MSKSMATSLLIVPVSKILVIVDRNIISYNAEIQCTIVRKNESTFNLRCNSTVDQ